MKDALGHGSDGTGTTGTEAKLKAMNDAAKKAGVTPRQGFGGTHSQGIQALPGMQRRHFEAIAAEFKSQPDAGSPEHAKRVSDMADKLATTNPGFRRDFFVKASTPGGDYNNKSRGRSSDMGKAAKVIKGMR
jgi:hypothetical protein